MPLRPRDTARPKFELVFNGSSLQKKDSYSAIIDYPILNAQFLSLYIP